MGGGQSVAVREVSVAGTQVQETAADNGGAAPESRRDAPAGGAPVAPAGPASASSGGSGFSLKSMLAGFLGIAVVSLYTSTNDRVLSISPLVGNHLPIGALSYVFALAVLWNPTVGRLGTWLRFGTREMAVILGMLFITSWIPGSSLYRYLEDAIAAPTLRAASNPQWQKNLTLTYIPDDLRPLGKGAVPDAAPAPATAATPGQPPAPSAGAAAAAAAPAAKPQPSPNERVYSNLATGDEKLKFTGAPYGDWLEPMKRWWFMAFAMATALIAMIWLVHRQWAHHEQLAYPIATVVTALIERTGSRLTSDIFSSRLFWGGFAPVFILHILNYLGTWFPDNAPKIVLEFWSWSDHSLFSVLNHSHDLTSDGHMFFAIVGLAYFIPSEISLSMGFSTIIMTVVGVMYYLAFGQQPSSENEYSTQAGAYLGYFIIMLYTARHYLVTVLKRAVGISRGDGRERELAWAARLFVVGIGVFIASLVMVAHIDWLLAILLASTTMVYFLVFARVVAETGVQFLQAPWDPGNVVCQVLGFPAVGPANLVMLQYISFALNPDARECLTPYVANTMKMADNVGVRVPRLITLGLIGTVVALLLGFLAQTYCMYFKGAGNLDPYSMDRPAAILNRATTGLQSLNDLGLTHLAESKHGLVKLTLLADNTGHGTDFGWMGFGLMGVMALSILRFRYLWWPLHPVVFLVWGTWTAMEVWMSFLLGWIIKSSVVRYGGGRTYQQLKPLFLGMIMGELAATAVSVVCGGLYYLCMHKAPVKFDIFPG